MSSTESREPADLHTRWWRSTAERSGRPEFRALLEAEFPGEADPAGFSRRRWLQLMAASLAFGAASGCRWKEQEIVPLVRRPPDYVPGQPRTFATVMELAGSGVGVLVTAIDGRPVKIEGNPKHPLSLGATDAWAQAAILDLYDPDRASPPIQRTSRGAAPRAWNDFAKWWGIHAGGLEQQAGRGLCVLAEVSSSPSLARLRGELLRQYPKAQWFCYDPLADDNLREGARLAFGKPYRPQLRIEQADVIACLDADLLAQPPTAVACARAYAQGRNPATGRMNRLYAVESCLSITGAAADHRLPLESNRIAAVAAVLEAEVARLLGAESSRADAPGEDAAAVDRASGSGKPAPLQFVRAMARDLVDHRGRALVVAGPRQPPEVHWTVWRINALLESMGSTLVFSADPDPQRAACADEITRLAGQMHAGEVETLVVLGGNPVYNAPVDLDFAAGLAKVPNTIHLGRYRDETSEVCTWHLPQAHWLECWGDARAYNGLYSVAQPLLAPLFEGRSAIELIALLVGGSDADAQQLVRQTFAEVAGTADENSWRTTLLEGLLPNSEWPVETPQVQMREIASAALSEAEAALGGVPSGLGSGSLTDRLEIVFLPSPATYDGRLANNGWLQETPHPLTKLTWDNAALLSPAAAEALGVGDEDLVQVEYRGRTLELPVCVLPGQAAATVGVELGYGRTAAGRVGGLASEGIASVGTDTYRLRTSKAMQFDGGLILRPTVRRRPLACTQDHFAIDAVGMQGRAQRLGQLLRQATLAQFQADPHVAQHVVHHPPLESLWQEHAYPGHRWAMAVDLSKCIGCNACMAACQAENNVPIVGKAQVRRGREMHWIRIDRYFRGDPDDPEVAFQPVACHHCENAPCEQVCPVGATVHSGEGLNDMVYNRCVGTRYCSNNCPYKVRRFNYFWYHKNLDVPGGEIRKLVFNPEVTVRTRGVMEKCTYCVQRIQAVKIAARNADIAGQRAEAERLSADGAIRTACQQACPTGAITFGDLSDRQSRVAALHASPLAYALLGELNVKPRTVYLARIRNPNPQLASHNDEHEHHSG